MAFYADMDRGDYQHDVDEAFNAGFADGKAAGLAEGKTIGFAEGAAAIQGKYDAIIGCAAIKNDPKRLSAALALVPTSTMDSEQLVEFVVQNVDATQREPSPASLDAREAWAKQNGWDMDPLGVAVDYRPQSGNWPKAFETALSHQATKIEQ